ncbi:MAG: glycoside hydrolase family 30 beta sandwich domain-containing protein, partial [Candidatus Neomarinimicrobiota bacterium]
NIIIGASRNWCKTIIEWNLASDENQEPHTNGGCRNCLGAVTITNDNVKRNTAYYAIAHASKFVPPGSKRIYSSTNADLPNVAFLTEDKKLVIIVLNDSDRTIDFNINLKENSIHSSLTSGSIGTYIWNFET